VQITQGINVKQLTFTYDPFGRRISKTIVQDGIGTDCANNTCPRTTNYVYDQENIILEYDQAGAIKTKYTHGLGIDEPLAVQQGTNTYYYHADGLGSITSLSNASGSIVQTYSYDSFGNMTATGNVSQPFTYTGREYDSETGMYFYRARYYDPKVGRFVTKDPIGFKGGINLYVYVENNPLSLTDALGLASKYNPPSLTATPSPFDVFDLLKQWYDFFDQHMRKNPDDFNLVNNLRRQVPCGQKQTIYICETSDGCLYGGLGTVLSNDHCETKTIEGNLGCNKSCDSPYGCWQQGHE
jgi:RHS repeat-associated protein